MFLDLGHSYGIPLEIYAVRSIHFDTASFEAAGRPRPHPGLTQDGFRGAVTTLARQGDQPRSGFADAKCYDIVHKLPRAINKQARKIETLC